MPSGMRCGGRMSFVISHTVLSWCWWDLVALLVLVGVSIYSWRKLKKLKDAKKQLEDRLASLEAAAAVPTETAIPAEAN